MPMTIRIRTVGLDTATRRYGRARRSGEAAMRKAAEDARALMVRELRAATPVGATGNLKASTKGSIVKTGQGFRTEVIQNAASPQGFQYQSAVNAGTRPHFPPPAALVAWVTAKWGLTGQEAVSGAWRLAVSISRRGTRANPYVEKAFRIAKTKLKGVAQKAGAKYASDLRRS